LEDGAPLLWGWAALNENEKNRATTKTNFNGFILRYSLTSLGTFLSLRIATYD
jgi:hypothetical protein